MSGSETIRVDVTDTVGKWIDTGILQLFADFRSEPTDYVRTIKPRFFPVVNNFGLPDFEVSLAKNGSIELTLPDTYDPRDDVSSISTSILEAEKEVLVIPAERIMAFPHDFSCLILSTLNDTPMFLAAGQMEILEEKTYIDVPIEFTNLNATPDILSIKEFSRNFLEFATTQGNPMVAVNVVSDKNSKYIPMLETIQAENLKLEEPVHVTFDVIVVSSTGVTSTLPLDNYSELVDRLVARFRWSLQVMHTLVDKGMVTMNADTEEWHQDLRAISHLFTTIAPDYDNPEDFGGRGITEEKLAVRPEDAHAMESALSKYLAAFERSLKTTHAEALAEMSGACQLDKISAVEKFEKELRDDNKNRTTHIKSIVKFPCCIPPNSGAIPRTVTGDLLIHRVWREALTKMSSKLSDVLCPDDLEEDQREAKLEELHARAMRTPSREIINEEQKGRKHKGVIELNLSADDWVRLATVGINGKKHHDNPEVTLYRELKKMPLSYDVYTTDIDKFIRDERFFSKAKWQHPSTLKVRELVASALEIHDAQASDWCYDIVETFGFQLFDFIAAASTEIAVTYRQNHTKPSHMRIKKIANYNCLVLIKNTSGVGHMFFSLCFPKQDCQIIETGAVFRPLIDAGEFWVTDFVSFKPDKVENYVSGSSIFMNSCVNWARARRCDLQAISGLDQSSKMLTLTTMLFLLDDKSRSEEIATLLRYCCMEKFKTIAARPHKILEKVDTVFRSRLQVWGTKILVKNIMSEEYIRQIVTNDNFEKDEGIDQEDFRVCKTEGLLDRVKYGNMINPFTGFECTGLPELIETFYIGYAVNKNQIPENNTASKLLEKILKYEDKKFTTRPQFFGSESMEAPPKGEASIDKHFNFHEYSRDVVISMAEIMREHFRKLLGQTWETKIHQDITTRFNRRTWSEIATNKASSTFDPNEGETGEKNVKVCLAVLRKMEIFQDTPGKSMGVIMDLMNSERRNELYITIFKKQQHGGLREIYILEVCNRVMQMYLEDISRALLDYIPYETMMNPKAKLEIPQRFQFDVISSDKTLHKITLNSSNDAMVWNQGHHVSKFALFLTRLLPSQYKGIIVSGLKCWERKCIKVPESLIEIWNRESNKLKPNSDPLIERLRLAYFGNEEPWFAGGKNPHLKIETGMMQGILHYTSSLFHASLLLLRDKFFHSLIDQKFSNLRGQVITADMVSSDDSSRMTGLMARTSNDFYMLYKIAKADHHCMDEFSKYSGIHMSIKSTVGTHDLMEFNSDWYANASLIRPVIKWALVTSKVIEVEGFTALQEHMASQLTALLEAGAPFLQTHVTQFSQAFMYYKLIGSQVNPLFSMWADLAMETKDPSIGFFLMDIPCASGLLGHHYNFYRAVIHSPKLNCRLAACIREKANLMKGELTTTSSGTLTRGTAIRFGDRRRWKRHVEELVELGSKFLITKSWGKAVLERPDILYRFDSTKESSVVKILAQGINPAMGASMAKFPNICRILGASLYVISRQAISVSSAWLQLVPEEEWEPKYSLLKLARDEVENQEELSDEELLTIFPFREDYDNMSGILEEVQTRFLFDYFANVPNHKSTRTTISVYESYNAVPVSLESCAKRKWFGMTNRMTTTMNEQSWNFYKASIRWLKDTHDETLEASPFEDPLTLRNFLARFEERGRNVRLTGVPLRLGDSRSSNMVTKAVVLNPWPGKKISTRFSQSSKSADALNIRHTLFCLGECPMTKKVRLECMRLCLRESNEFWDGSVAMPSRRADATVSCMQSFAKGDLLTFRKKLEKARLGVRGVFTLRQRSRIGHSGRRKVHYTGSGLWAGHVGSVAIRLYLEDDCIVKLEVDSKKRFYHEMDALKEFARENGWVWGKRNPDGSPMTEFEPHVRFDGHTVRESKTGTKLLEVDMSMQVGVNYESLWLEWKEGVLRIRGSLIERSQNSFTILSFKPTGQDLVNGGSITPPSLKSRSFILEAYSKLRPLEHNVAIELLQAFCVFQEGVEIKIELAKFIKKHLMNQLMGLERPSLDEFQPAARVEINMSEFMSRMWEHVGDIDNIDLLLEQGDPDSQFTRDHDFLKMFDFEFIDTSYMTKVEDIGRATQSNHPLFTSLINHVENNPVYSSLVKNKRWKKNQRETEWLYRIMTQLFGWQVEIVEKEEKRRTVGMAGMAKALMLEGNVNWADMVDAEELLRKNEEDDAQSLNESEAAGD